MELRVLEYFVTTATEMNMTKAAQRLHITQPTLSIQLRDLEDELGTILFERTNRGISLTQDGEYFFSKAKDILTIVNDTISNLQNTDDVAGPINIGGAETHHNELLFKILKSIRIDHPRISCHYVSGNANQTMPLLDSGVIDFAVVMGHVDKSKYNHIDLPYEDHFILITKKDNPLAQLSTITKDDIEKEPLITSGQSHVDTFLESWLGQSIDSYEISGTYTLINNGLFMVKADLGSAIAIDGLVNTEGTDLCTIPLSPTLTVNSSIIWRKNQALSQASQLFLDTLQEEISNHSKE